MTLGEVAPAAHTLRGARGHDASTRRCAVVQICISLDAQWIATADGAHCVAVHSLDGLCFSSAVPMLTSPPTALAFLPASSLLAIASANKQLTLYDVDRATLAPCGAAHAHPIAAVASSPEVPSCIAVNPANPLAPILCAHSWLCRIPVVVDGGCGSRNGDKAAASAPVAANLTSSGRAVQGKAKRKRANEGADPALVVRNYGSMLLFAVLAADEAVVVEQPWLRVMEHFPPALYKHRFGT